MISTLVAREGPVEVAVVSGSSVAAEKSLAEQVLAKTG
jgi:hypothetical protein